MSKQCDSFHMRKLKIKKFFEMDYCICQLVKLNSFWSFPGKKILKRQQSCKLQRLFVYRCSEREKSFLHRQQNGKS